MVRVRQPGLLLGEWVCLAALGQGRLHGFAVARRLAPDGDLGRVWTMSRPLTYRAIGTLTEMGFVRLAGEESGQGPVRSLLVLTPKGRAALRRWLDEPVAHPRDVRSELLLKIVVCGLMGRDPEPLVSAQLARFEAHRAAREVDLADDPLDPVRLWRVEFAEASIAFLNTISADATA
jgi:DNA-binding PadR family transcriptional regulator